MIGQQMVSPTQRNQALSVANNQVVGGGLPVSTMAQTTGTSPLLAAPATAAAPITANTTMTTTGLPVQQSTAGAPPTGLIGSEAALQAGYDDATGMMGEGYDAANARLLEYRKAMNNRTLNLNTSLGGEAVGAINQGVAAYDPYTQGGANAQKLYDDYLGINGKDAQSAAMQAYQDSPVLQRQIDQMQRTVERSASARGGLMSGAVMQELQRNAQGLASQDYFKNLGAIGESANRGLNAASGVAGLRGQQAQMSTQLQGIGLQAQAQYEMQKEATRADIASQLSGLAESRGLNASGLRVGLSQEQAAGRANAGMAMAQNATQAASNIAQYLNQQGVGVSDMMSKDISNITDFMYQSGMQDKADMQNLADLIARINGAQGATVMQGQQDIGAAKAAGTLGVANAITGGVTQGIATGLIGGK